MLDPAPLETAAKAKGWHTKLSQRILTLYILCPNAHATLDMNFFFFFFFFKKKDDTYIDYISWPINE